MAQKQPTNASIEQGDVPDEWLVIHDPRNRNQQEYQLQLYPEDTEESEQSDETPLALIGVEKSHENDEHEWEVDVQHDAVPATRRHTLLGNVAFETVNSADEACELAKHYANNIEQEVEEILDS
jgi:hypothetical protein